MALRFIENLNPRERRLVNVLGAVLVLGVLLGIPVALEAFVHARAADNQEIMAALTAVQNARTAVRERQEKKDALRERYAKKAPPLAGFLEEAAHKVTLEVTDSVDRPDVPHGKRFAERSTTVHLRKASLLPIAKLLETIERSGYPIEISKLSLRKRAGEPDSYDVEVAVSAYDRVEPASGSTAAAPSAGAP